MIVDKHLEIALNKLQKSENVFKYKVQPESAQISSILALSRNSEVSSHRKAGINNVFFTEVDEASLGVKNHSDTLSIRNIHVLCSHPIVFGVLAMPLNDGHRLMSS